MTTIRPLAVGITPLETRREVVLHLATRAEELGYTAFFVAEAWGHDVSVLLTEIAIRTSRIQLGTGVLNIWGRSAGSIAMLASSLAELSGGRFVLGLGAGSPQLAEGLHDVAFRAPVERLGAVTRQVRRLLDGGRIVSSVSGGSRPLRLGVPPSSDIPIQLAALGPAAVRLCGELADCWYPFLLPASGLKEGLRLIEDGAARGGPGRPLPRICPGLPVAVAPDPARARALASWWVAFYLTSMGPLYARTLRNHGFGAAVDAVLAANPTHGTSEVPAAAAVLLDELTIWGNPDAARAALSGWYAAGADMPVLVLPPNRDRDELDAVLDALRPSSP
ncbi:LLM class flavin-dependent oxidoreductase [Pseudonocardia sp. Cha107L01]|uniref:LLM class flavin-dependent oxidoreductase n=1 Tax=Pseudonocardia sp. Cha107L01 TaxID=3457576 RepID=UPI00403E7094